MKFPWLTLWCLGAAAASGTPAAAQSLSADQILQQFNAVIFNNFSSSADVEGRTVVGQNMTGGATFALNPTAEAASTFAALTVYGNQTAASTLNLDNAEGVAIAGTNAGTFNLNGGGSVYVGGMNSGGFNSTTGSASVDLMGGNKAQVSLGSGGSVYVGSTNSGNVTISGGTTASDSVSIKGSNTASLTLNKGGTVKVTGNAGSGTLDGGSLTYGGTKGIWNLNAGATSSHSTPTLTTPGNPLPSFTSTFQTPLTTLSSQLAAMTPNSSVVVNGNNVTLQAHPDATGMAVLALTTSVLAPNDTVSVALNGATSFIIDLSVAGCSKNCTYSIPSSVHFQNPTSYASSVLWNITNINSLSFSNEFGGSVLAPTTAVTSSGPIDGTLVALSFSGTGELRDHPYTGRVRAPEPSSLAVLSVALLGTGFLRRRWRSGASL